jgi:hypothetical protein
MMRMIDRLGSFDPCATPSANDRYLRIPAEDGVGRKAICRLYGKSAAVRVS